MKYLKNAQNKRTGLKYPVNAVKEFLKLNKKFKHDDPEFLFNESHLKEKNKITYWPMAYLKRLK